MSASITLANLSWSTPEGRPLLREIDLSFIAERTGLVGRNGAGKTTILKLVAGDLAPQTGRVEVSGTLGVLRQTVQVGPGETVADLFDVRQILALLERAEAGEAGVDELARADWTLPARLAAALARLGLDAAPQTRLSALSGGQRTRAALAALVFAEPDFILLDEPTNNLDREGRRAVIDLLEGWKGGAIVVSHDRELLDTMDAIVELTTLGTTRYGGNWSRYRDRKAVELAAARHELADAERRVDEVGRHIRQIAERKARRDRGGERTRARGDIPRIQLNAMKNRSENTSGANARTAERLRTQALGEAAAARRKVEVLQSLTVALPSTGLAAGKLVLKVDGVRAGYAAERPILHELSFEIVGPERVAVTGPNGSGKTTLLAVITGQLQPAAGDVRMRTRFALLDQQVSLLDPALSIRDNIRRINPQLDENACRAALARFMFRADAALQTVATLSGGQMLRAGLGCVLAGDPPPLLILDEPTNHLDIESIEAVEAGLRAYDGALLIVSHDEPFLEAVGVTRRLELPA
jgi:ATPase subunit of ABC transporter with duplicated ATPase domains